MAISYKQRCARCKKNFVLVSRNQFPLCYDCQKTELAQVVKNPKMKKMFNIPEELYKQNTFLREIKLKYLKFGALSEKQIEVFIRVAKELQEKKAEPILETIPSQAEETAQKGLKKSLASNHKRKT